MEQFETNRIMYQDKFYIKFLLYSIAAIIFVLFVLLILRDSAFLKEAYVHFGIALGALSLLSAFIVNKFMSYDYEISFCGYYTYFFFNKYTIRLKGSTCCHICGKKFRLEDEFGHITPWVHINKNIMREIQQTHVALVISQQ